MNNIISERLLNICGAFLFCISISLILYLSHGVYDISESVLNGMQHDDSLAEIVYEDTMKVLSISYSQVVCELMNDGLEYDLEINKKIISKDNYNMSNLIGFIPIYDSYTKRIIRDEDGKITKIKYEVETENNGTDIN